MGLLPAAVDSTWRMPLAKNDGIIVNPHHIEALGSAKYSGSGIWSALPTVIKPIPASSIPLSNYSTQTAK